MTEVTGQIGASTVIWAITIIFFCGAAWMKFKRLVRDVNGLGGKLDRIEKDRKEKNESLRLAIVALACDKNETAVQLLGER